MCDLDRRGFKNQLNPGSRLEVLEGASIIRDFIAVIAGEGSGWYNKAEK
jgi:hypothetical protein